MITTIVKRDGREVPFHIEKIADAIFKAAQALGGKDYDTAMELAQSVVRQLEEQYQDTVCLLYTSRTVAFTRPSNCQRRSI